MRNGRFGFEIEITILCQFKFYGGGLHNHHRLYVFESIYINEISKIEGNKYCGDSDGRVGSKYNKIVG